jgi:hypothetical protein
MLLRCFQLGISAFEVGEGSRAIHAPAQLVSPRVVWANFRIAVKLGLGV